MAISVNSNGATTASNPTAALVNSVQSIQDSINANPAVITNPSGTTGAVPGTLTTQAVNGAIMVGVIGSNGRPGPTFPLGKPALYVSLSTSTAAPGTGDLPKDGNYGWHFNSSTGEYSFAYNSGGSIVFQSIDTLSGKITSTQHGDLSAVDTSLPRHVFSQITGAITLVQHGNLGSGSVSPHDFSQISGTVSDTQHGSRAGGSLHPNVVVSGASGFMTGVQAATLASILTIVNDITSTGAVSELLNCTQLQVSGTKVVGARDTVWTIAGGLAFDKALVAYTPNAAYTPSDLVQLAKWINGIVVTLQVHGLLG